VWHHRQAHGWTAEKEAPSVSAQETRVRSVNREPRLLAMTARMGDGRAMDSRPRESA